MKGIFSAVMIVLLCFSTFFVFAPRATAASASPVGYWTFDEGSGSIAGDSSGNGNTGTLMNGPQWVQGIEGTALGFDGVASYVSVPASPSLNVLGNQVSAELWFKPTVTLDSSTHSTCIIDKGNAYSFCLNMPPYQPAPNGKIFFIIVVGSQQYEFVETTTSVWTAGTWYHIAGTYDGSYIRIYVNGALQNSRPVTGTLWQDPTPSPFAMGAYCHGPARDWFFNGAIDEVKIYNYARTAQEIWDDHALFSGPRVLAWGYFDGGIDVPYQLPDGTTFTYRGWLQSKGYSVSTDTEVFPHGDVTSAELQEFQAVILDDWFLADPASNVYVSLIVDYVNHGGGLIILGEYGDPQMTLDEALGFHWIESPWSFEVDAVPTDTLHPVMQGINEMPKSGGVFVDWDALIAESPLPSSTAVLARTTGGGGYYDPSNVIALIAFEFGDGRVVSGPGHGLMRPYAPTSVNGMDVIGTPVIENKLLINAINWVARARLPTKWAVVLGDDEYDLSQGATQQQGPVNSALDFYNMLVANGFPSGNVHLRTDMIGIGTDDITRDIVVAELDWLDATVRAGDLAVFYYAGHGGHGSDMDHEWLVLHDRSGIRDDEFADLIGRIGAERLLVVLDMSLSGGFITDGQTWQQAMPGVYTSQTDLAGGRPDGRVVLTSCAENVNPPARSRAPSRDTKSDEFTYPGTSRRWEMVFTHFLINGFNGDADFNEDARVTVEEAFLWAKFRAMYTQTPMMYDGYPAYGSSGDLYLE